MSTLSTSEFALARLRARAKSGPPVGRGAGKGAQPGGGSKAPTSSSPVKPYSPNAVDRTKEQRKRAL